MSGAHLHLILNHIPVLGAVFGLLLLSYGVFRRNDGIVRACLWWLVIVGLAGLATYLTGEPAEEVIEDLPGVSESIIERHEEAATLATIGGGIVGVVALAGLLVHRAKPIGRRFASVMLLLTLGLFGGMAWTAYLGGQIRHPEVRPGQPAQAGEVQAERGAAGGDEEDRED